MRENIIQKRKELGLTQKAAAKQIGIAQPSYCDIEHGKKNPSVNTAKAIGQVLGINWAELFEE